jgi:hypothetical protein
MYKAKTCWAPHEAAGESTSSTPCTAEATLAARVGAFAGPGMRLAKTVRPPHKVVGQGAGSTPLTSEATSSLC